MSADRHRQGVVIPNRDRPGAADRAHQTGAYYTPTRVVDYIVTRTLGKLLRTASLPRSRGSVPALRVLDPACGAGAFLLGAYQDLLDWYRERERRLGLRERASILLGHIYGVDLDPQAVKTTRHALLSKLLEGETVQTPTRFRRRVRRLLGKTIKCGNALIGFDWSAEFPQTCGRFDVVIGNPPYLSFSGRQATALSQTERAYFARHYRTAGWPTTHGLFIELALRLARRCVGFIVPDQVGHLAGYATVRQAILQWGGLREVRYWGEQVFPGAVTPTLTFVADTGHRGATRVYSRGGGQATRACCGSDPWTAGADRRLLDKLRSNAISLGKLVADIGVHTGNCADKLIRPLSERGARCVPILEGRQVSRYRCAPPTKVLRPGYAPSNGEYFRVRPRHKYAAARFVIRQTAAFPIVGPFVGAECFRNSLLALYGPTDGTDVRYLVGILNSRLIRYVYMQTVQESRQRAFPQVKIRALRELPVRRMDLADLAERRRHNRLVRVVQEMLDLHAAPARNACSRIRRLDRRIDRSVYELYGLTAVDVKTIEDATT
jgi:hypothetical protein